MTGAVEEYLEAIYRVSGKRNALSTTGLAERLNVKPASVTGMLKRLAEMNLISYRRYGRIELTVEGRRRARSIIRRHRLAERLLTDVLGVPLDRVHDEACRLEHALSPDIESRIADRLGESGVCPHGNPLDVTADRTVSLLDAPANRRLAITRLEDESAEVVRYLAERGLLPGAAVTVKRRDPLGSAVEIEVNGQAQTIGRALAETIWVARPERVRAA
ncbi:MAG: metal-dependent transcriptional regulator [Armatimonadota bacterium]